MPISSGTGILPVQMSRHDKSHGQDVRATGVAPIDPSGPANLSWRQTTSARSRYVFIETALVSPGRAFLFGRPARAVDLVFGLSGQHLFLAPVHDVLEAIRLDERVEGGLIGPF